MNCSKCQRPNSDSAVYCEYCGTKLQERTIFSNSPYQNMVSIGRSNQNNIVIQDNEVSSNHCRIYNTKDGIVIEDLNSTNGTSVNGRKVIRAFINQNDNIKLGKSRLNLYDSRLETIFGASSYAVPNVKTKISGGYQMPQQQMLSSSSSAFPFLSWLSAGGLIIVLICFFLPWVEFSCGFGKSTASGMDIGGVFWVIFFLALITLILFFVFTSIKKARTAAPFLIISSIISLLILIWKIIEFYQGNDLGYGLGKVKPSDIGFSLREGIFGTVIGLVLTLIGSFLLKNDDENINNRL